MNHYKLYTFDDINSTEKEEFILDGDFVYNYNMASNLTGENSRGNQCAILTIESTNRDDMDALIALYQSLKRAHKSHMSFLHLDPEDVDIILLSFENKKVLEYGLQIGNSLGNISAEHFCTSVRISIEE